MTNEWTIAAVVLMVVAVGYFIFSQRRFKSMMDKLSRLDPEIASEFGLNAHPSTMSWSQQRRLVALVRNRSRRKEEGELVATARAFTRLYENSIVVVIVYMILMTILIALH
jgi:hypothetical protein